MKLKDLMEKYGEYEIYPDSPKHIEDAFKNLDTTNDGVLCLYAKKPKPKTVWDLKDGDQCIYIDAFGKITGGCLWNEVPQDERARDVGNIFLTKEEAEQDIERRKVETLLLKYGGRRWSTKFTENHYLWYDVEESALEVATDYAYWVQGTIYFDSEEQVLQAIDGIGESRIKKALFGVD